MHVVMLVSCLSQSGAFYCVLFTLMTLTEDGGFGLVTGIPGQCRRSSATAILSIQVGVSKST